MSFAVGELVFFLLNPQPRVYVVGRITREADASGNVRVRTLGPENFKCSYYQRPNSPGFVKPLDAITRLGLIVRGGLEDWER